MVLLLHWLVSTQPLPVQKGEAWTVQHGKALLSFDGLAANVTLVHSHGIALVHGWLWPVDQLDVQYIDEASAACSKACLLAGLETQVWASMTWNTVMAASWSPVAF